VARASAGTYAGGADSITSGSLIRTSANAVWDRAGTPLSAPDIDWRRNVEIAPLLIS
jgi:hypothetical protein